MIDYSRVPPWLAHLAARVEQQGALAISQLKPHLDELVARTRQGRSDDLAKKLLIATIVGISLIIVLSLFFGPRSREHDSHRASLRAIEQRSLQAAGDDADDSSLYTSDDSSSSASQHSSNIIITSSDTTSNLSVRPVHVELLPSASSASSSNNGARNPWRSPPLRSSSPLGNHHQHIAANKRRRRKTQQRLSVHGLGILGDGNGSSTGADDDEEEEEEEDDEKDAVEAADAVASIQDESSGAADDQHAPQQDASHSSLMAKRSSLRSTSKPRRPRTKRKIGSVSTGNAEAPAPIPARNSSYHKAASVVEPDPVLIGRCAKDAPPSILRKEAQRFRALWARAHHASDFVDSRQERQQRLIKLTEPDWDPYAETHERARQRIEMRQLASKGLARVKSESALSEKANRRQEEPLGSWLAYAPIHSPSDDDEDATVASAGAPTLPKYEWETTFGQTFDPQLETTEALPDGLTKATNGHKGDDDFWFERFTSSTAAAGRDWDWRKRRARERAQADAAMAAAIENGTPMKNGHSANVHPNGHAALQSVDPSSAAAAAARNPQNGNASPSRQPSSPGQMIAAAFSRPSSSGGGTSPSPKMAPFRRGSSSS
ncbi:hypothetical protein BDZ90DRAFT_230187 [Jaminaea rosea]|uniref:Uncharacterized protein n=1 Tax=Jaminaea rosea TaxID=1569628 RepID=A0A316V1K0_9BASI|nr:hypothetical protein BDZ90DRAFT_230187 [Jaminaea rosea]PWN29295.1 hypothetical protein BDZ90DRAFT_230187 [Jaminaea rosea]